MLLGVSAPISTMPVSVLSMACMILSCSAGSSLAWYSPKVLMFSSPPKTDW